MDDTNNFSEIRHDLNNFETDLVLEESSSVAPGNEVDLIANIQKQMEKEKLSSGSDQINFESAILKEKKTEKTEIGNFIIKLSRSIFQKVIVFFKFTGILILIFSGLLTLNLLDFNYKAIILIAAYTLSIIGLAVYYFILYRQGLKKSMELPLGILNDVSRGKLSFDILNDKELYNELGKFALPIDTIIKKISDVVSKVELSALDLAGNSDALTHFAMSMAEKTEEQSKSLDMIDNSAKDLNDSMQLIKENVERAYNISKTSIHEADNSSKEVLLLIEEMNRIHDMSDKIINTMNFIEDIAAETNLLALNAAIQAAHAGEEGKGFGVVATEIKNLAQSSSAATKVIFEIIDQTVNSIRKGVTASQTAKKELLKIVNSFKTTEDLMSSINNSINLQSRSTNQLKESLDNIHELTGNINSDTQNMKSAITNLSGQAQILTRIISYFELAKSKKLNSEHIFGVDE